MVCVITEIEQFRSSIRVSSQTLEIQAMMLDIL